MIKEINNVAGKSATPKQGQGKLSDQSSACALWTVWVGSPLRRREETGMGLGPHATPSRLCTLNTDQRIERAAAPDVQKTGYRGQSLAKRFSALAAHCKNTRCPSKMLSDHATPKTGYMGISVSGSWVFVVPEELQVTLIPAKAEGHLSS